ncbi:hypothetical protein GGS26DRAFT_570599 [Hypomontagnella submonticulosa]|nr:hypothetical protein GGS26DRAFT_570599 [Hypomontagnella submonticulosa]
MATIHRIPLSTWLAAFFWSLAGLSLIIESYLESNGDPLFPMNSQKEAKLLSTTTLHTDAPFISSRSGPRGILLKSGAS